MKAVAAVIEYTIKQHVRHRVYLTILLFGLLLLCGGLIISTLAIEEQIRMLVNVGLSGIEFISLIAVVFVTVNLILEEMETKSIYLVLSHPIERWQYVTGRYLGTMAALVFGMLAMAALHLAGLWLKGWTWDVFYPIAFLCSVAKIAVVGSMALLISLATTSTASSMTLTGFFWVLGHFSTELGYMADRSENFIVKGLIGIIHQIAPNFAYFNYRDFWQASQIPDLFWFGWLTLYSMLYIAVMLFLTNWIFSTKEL